MGFDTIEINLVIFIDTRTVASFRHYDWVYEYRFIKAMYDRRPSPRMSGLELAYCKLQGR